jgi:ABC-type transporter Mla MlaB component
VSPEALDSPLSRRGVVRLLNTTGGRLLCLAGTVDAAAVDAFWRRYGREPARVDRIDARSVTALSEPGVELLLDHVEAAELAGRPVELRPSPAVTRVLTGREPGAGAG